MLPVKPSEVHGLHFKQERMHTKKTNIVKKTNWRHCRLCLNSIRDIPDHLRNTQHLHQTCLAIIKMPNCYQGSMAMGTQYIQESRKEQPNWLTYSRFEELATGGAAREWASAQAALLWRSNSCWTTLSPRDHAIIHESTPGNNFARQCSHGGSVLRVRRTSQPYDLGHTQWAHQHQRH